MRWRYHQIDTLPTLAWCARVDSGREEIPVFHGRGVETHEHGFSEGAWNGAYASRNIDSATIVCGTGAVLREARARFCGSTDRLSPLFSIVKGGSTFVSNSPVFAMGSAGETPDNLYPFYNYDLIRIWREGLYGPSGKLRTQSAIPLRVHFDSILSIDRQGEIRFECHPLCDAPTEFASYKRLLAEGVASVFENGRDPARNTGYQPLAALSRGYDANATAALASRAGAREAVTFRNNHSKEEHQDSGAGIASYLGMKCTEYERMHYLELGGRAEAEFGLCTIATNPPLAAMEEQLSDRILITGNFGDAIWGKVKSGGCANMSYPWARFTSGLSQLEFRLRVGYLTFTPPYIAARHNLAIHRINNSEEMLPWSVEGAYDRPVPRRIGEEAGIPRDEFGMQKDASGHAKYTRPENFSKEALAHYREFVNRSHGQAARSRYHYWRNQVRLRHARWALFGSNQRRLVPSSPLQRRFPFLLNATPARIPWEFMFTYQWAFETLRPRYELPAPASANDAG